MEVELLASNNLLANALPIRPHITVEEHPPLRHV